jgi:hypothetical protein
MKVTSIRPWTAVIAALALAPVAAHAASRSYVYTVRHAKYGVIGVYSRAIDDSGGETRARSHLQIQVKIMGITMHREVADQSETWRDGRLMTFQSDTLLNGKDMKVSGQAQGGGFAVTSAAGIVMAPPDVAASDPWSFSHTGHGTVVSLRSGKLDQVDITGGEPDRVVVNGVPVIARHFRVSTATQPNKWEAWLEADGLPVKFRSFDHGAAVDFTLASHNP